MKFEELPLNNNVLDALYDMHFDTCTPVQEKCIPEILKGKDVLGVAQTGTGKTAAYLLPILSKIDSGNYPNDAINCLIMSPTRELAQQIDQAMQGFGYYLHGVSSVAVYGGNDGNRYDQELKSLRLGADVVIATPGRLISHINLGNVDMSKISFFVLDEADRMLDMGFAEDIITIAKLLPKSCQTIMFSATMPDKINELARTLLKNPTEIKLAVSKPAEKIKQSAYVCYENQKLGIIKEIFKQGNLKRVIIFCGAKQKVKQVTGALQRMKINCGEMHSDLEQAERDEVMFQFKSGQIDVLVATDIVARGIDIDDIAMVINYDVPRDTEDYVHRIGRTARADREGVAITLVSKDDIGFFMQIEKFLQKEIKKMPLPLVFGDAPAYTTEGNAPRKHASAKSVRRKNRDQTAHKHKPRKNNNEAQHDEDVPNSTNKNVNNNQLQHTAPNKKQKTRNADKLSKDTNQTNQKQDKKERTNQKQYNKRNTQYEKQSAEDNKKQANNKQRGKQHKERVNTENNYTNKNLSQESSKNKKYKYNKKQKSNAKQEVTYQGTRKFEASKQQPKKESALSAIIKKPLRWLKSLRKK